MSFNIDMISAPRSEFGRKLDPHISTNNVHQTLCHAPRGQSSDGLILNTGCSLTRRVFCTPLSISSTNYLFVSKNYMFAITKRPTRPNTRSILYSFPSRERRWGVVPIKITSHTHDTDVGPPARMARLSEASVWKVNAESKRHKL